MPSNFTSETLHVTKFSSINHGWNCSWKVLFLALTHAFIWADGSIVSVLHLHCSLSSGLHCSFLCFCSYPPLKQQTATRLLANWRLSIEDVGIQSSSIFLTSLSTVVQCRCMLVESSSVWDVRFSSMPWSVQWLSYRFTSRSCILAWCIKF